jgi:putative acetyltransferase
LESFILGQVIDHKYKIGELNMITLKRTSSDDTDFSRLVELLDEDLWKRYPDTQQNFVPFNSVNPHASVIVAYADDKAVGCGCFREAAQRDVVELKRMFVIENARGKGIAKAILLALEEWALEEGYKRAILETGINQPEAIALYNKIGYEVTEKYEPYVNSEESICMGKNL